ncbi:DinB family protein [Metabacillus sp. RGM 3146]|uniref:DinB family protein n=1 Tax=Metabacillus sp. RGM 3146 TaxID=3401092 RepID=UPI003B9A03D1
MLKLPTAQEYPSYFENYIRLVPDSDVKEMLAKQQEETEALLSSISEADANYRYAPEKWMLKEVIGHIIDTERIMCYRLLHIARGDKTPIAGYDVDQYVKEALFPEQSLRNLIENYTAVRMATLTLLRTLPEGVWERSGFANNGVVSVRALAYIMAGHELHHLNIIKERYL